MLDSNAAASKADGARVAKGRQSIEMASTKRIGTSMRLLLASTLIVLLGLAPALTGAEELGRDRLPVFQIDAADGTAISSGGRNDRPTVLLF